MCNLPETEVYVQTHVASSVAPCAIVISVCASHRVRRALDASDYSARRSRSYMMSMLPNEARK